MEQLTWCSRYHSWFLYPDDPLFVQIGAEIVREWEKEFGKGKYYLCDSFIEMSRSMPWLKDGDEATLKGLEACGRNIYGALESANPDAVWTLQGWIFVNAPNVWTKERADAFLSAVPADKMLLVDNCVECYNRKRYKHFRWNWDKYQSYNGRRWAWSPIPNYGGNTLPNGDLQFNANGHLSAIASGNRGALYSFGTMTEAIEVLDDVFEVLSAAGWRDASADPLAGSAADSASVSAKMIISVSKDAAIIAARKGNRTPFKVPLISWPTGITVGRCELVADNPRRVRYAWTYGGTDSEVDDGNPPTGLVAYITGAGGTMVIVR